MSEEGEEGFFLTYSRSVVEVMIYKALARATLTELSAIATILTSNTVRIIAVEDLNDE